MRIKKEMMDIKIRILVGITVSLLLALPAAASDYTLGVFGNANEDDTINMQDVTYTELIILEYRDRTELSDAKYDGKINMQDVTQIELVILGKEKEITILDSADRAVIVGKPIERIVAGYRHPIETLRALKVPEEMIVGVEETWLDPVFFPEFADTPTVGIVWNPDVEAILSLNPDLAILYGSTSPSREGTLATATDVLELAGVTVIRVSLTRPETYPELVAKLGYVFDRKEEAGEFNEFIERCLSSVSETTTIPEEDMPEVYFESSFGPYSVIMESCQPYIEIAGGKDVFAGLSGNIDPEAVVEQNPTIIVKKAPRAYRDRIGYGVDADDTEAMEEIRDEIMNRPELQNVDAIKTGQVHVVCGYLTPGGPVSGTRSFLLPAYLVKMFHPDRFEDLDPAVLHQEYVTEFQGLEIDLDEKGVFVYPLLEES